MNRQYQYLLLGLLAVGVVVSIPVGYVLWQHRVARNAATILGAARQYRDAGDTDKAIDTYAQYLAYAGNRVNDLESLAEYARLLGTRASLPDASPRRISETLPRLEAALRKLPHDQALRMRIADLLVRIRRFADAREHLKILQQSLAAVSDPSSGPTDRPAVTPPQTGLPTVDRYDVDLLLAKTWIGTGQYDEAATMAADIIGFHLKSNTFAGVSPTGGNTGPNTAETPFKPTTEAYRLLEGLLRDRLRQPGAADLVAERSVVANPTDAAAWFTYAERKWAARDVTVAREAFVRVTTFSQEDDPEAALAAIRIAQADAKPAEIAAAVTRAREEFPDDVRILQEAVRVADNRADFGQAINLINECIERRPLRPFLLPLLASVPIDLKRVDEAQAAIDALRALDGPPHPRTEMADLLEARLLFAKREWFFAKRKFEAVRPLLIGMEPVKKRIDMAIAECQGKLGDYDEQRASFERLIDDPAHGLQARIGVASAWISLGQPAKAMVAIRALDRAVEALPQERRQTLLRTSEPLLRLQVAAAAGAPSGQQDWRRVDGMIALRVSDPTFGPALLAMQQSYVLAEQGRTEEAIEVLQQAAAKSPESVPLRVALVSLVLQHDGTEAAREVLEKTPPNVRGSHDFMLAEAEVIARVDAKDTSGRWSSFADRALGIADPINSARVLSALAGIAQANGNVDEAQRLWKLAVERHPRDLPALMQLIHVSLQKNDPNEARLAADAIGALTGLDSSHHRYADAVTKVTTVRAARATPGSRKPTRGGSPEDKQGLRDARLLLIEVETQRPEWQAIQRLHADIDLLEGNKPAAIQRLQRAMELGPGRDELEREVAALLGKTGGAGTR
jgi:tetratricopeptide (TPR) repeat protein